MLEGVICIPEKESGSKEKSEIMMQAERLKKIKTLVTQEKEIKKGKIKIKSILLFEMKIVVVYKKNAYLRASSVG